MSILSIIDQQAARHGAKRKVIVRIASEGVKRTLKLQNPPASFADDAIIAAGVDGIVIAGKAPFGEGGNEKQFNVTVRGSRAVDTLGFAACAPDELQAAVEAAEDAYAVEEVPVVK